MQYQRYSTAAEFLSRTHSFLSEREVENALMVGLAQNIDKGFYPPTLDHYLASIEQGGEILLAALMIPPFNLLLATNSVDHSVLEELIARAHSLPAVPGVLGRKDVVGSFCKIWEKETQATVSLKMAERVFQLTEVIVPIAIEGTLRQATAADIDLIAEWVDQFGIDTGLRNEFRDPKAVAEARIKQESVYLWETNEGTPISMAATSRPTERGITINLVYTPPKFRGKGYASNCVAALSQMQLDKGFAYCTLFTDLSNPTSNSIYQKIGYKPVVDFDLYTFTYPS